MLCAVQAQVTCVPAFPTTEDTVTIFYDAAAGNGALKNVTPVYQHAGVITNLSTGPSDWKYVKTTWASTTATAQMTNVSPNIWSKKVHIRSFYGIPQGETATKLAFVFRNATGSIVGRASDGSDIYYDIVPDDGLLRTKFLTPPEPFKLTTAGQMISIKCAASEPATLRLFDNGTLLLEKINSETLDFSLTTSAGFHKIEFKAETATQTSTSEFNYLVPGAVTVENAPAGTQLGATVLSPGNLRFRLDAPGKGQVFVVGNFNNWSPTAASQMKKSVDGKTWWLDVAGVDFTQPVLYQYLVDGNIKIADPLSTLVLDPNNDNFIDAATWPNLPAYPVGKTAGTVSFLRLNQPAFNWQVTNFAKPKRTDLVIYELLVRDFLAAHNYPTLLDSLDYLQNLGINAIELMPINEFDGNINWGYSPAYHSALDKYYGSPELFKTFVDECHKRGIAVIQDVVFNHATGDSPLAKLYWDSANNRPAADNPWLNPVAKHLYNVYNDMNHESAMTKEYVDQCLKHWVEEYHVDGFRFDLSKGFTQKTSTTDAQMQAYDAGRIATLKHYGDVVWSKDPTSLCILEHFADNDEEKELSSYGFMLWGNIRWGYKEAALGYNAGANDMSWGVWKNRGWTAPHLVSYMESHDEERIGYECKTNGNTGNPAHNVKALSVATRRRELCDALFYTLPGPKMLWQFGELGYDYSINYCQNGTINNACRTDPKPIKWDFLADVSRKHLHDVAAALIHLRVSEDVFETTDFNLTIGQTVSKKIKLNSPTSNAVILGNVSVNAQSMSIDFQHTGTWYNYLTGEELQVNVVNQTFNLEPGGYRVFLDKKVSLPPGISLAAKELPEGFDQLEVFPNPTEGQLVVGFTLNKKSRITVDLFDLTGKLVKKLGSAEYPIGENYLENEVGSLAPGIYMLRILDENGGVATRKVLIK